MTEQLAIPAAFDLLRRRLLLPSEPEDLALPLRALQFRGLTRTELVVHLERLRAENEATNQDDVIEENCLLALDVVSGSVTGALVWDDAHRAAALLPRAVPGDEMIDAVPIALRPSNLLPPRDAPVSSGLDARLGAVMLAITAQGEWLPSKAEFFRAPKDAFTSRPAALLAFPDRVALEALAGAVERQLERVLPAEVLWPRERGVTPEAGARDTVSLWESSYVVVTDIASFYESVDHSLLAVFLAQELQVTLTVARALESLLGAIMGLPRGLPQGPLASDVLASAYLAPVDRLLHSRGVRFVRYQDDYFFPAESVSEGRDRLEQLESLLRELGLTLNSPKTKIFKRDTYLAGPEHRTQEMRRTKTELLEQIFGSDDADVEAIQSAAEVFAEFGIDEDDVWGALYHKTESIDALVSQIVDAGGPEFAALYDAYFRAVADVLAQGLGQHDPALLELVAGEALTFLPETPVELADADLRRVQRWFPKLAPLVVEYLRRRPPEQQPAALAYVGDYLRTERVSDWADAWMCFGAGSMANVNDAIVDALQERSVQEQPLTRLEAVRALAAHGALTEQDWMSQFENASVPIRAEMLFAGLVDADGHPWLASRLESLQPELRALAVAFLAAE